MTNPKYNKRKRTNRRAHQDANGAEAEDEVAAEQATATTSATEQNAAMALATKNEDDSTFNMDEILKALSKVVKHTTPHNLDSFMDSAGHEVKVFLDLAFTVGDVRPADICLGAAVKAIHDRPTQSALDLLAFEVQNTQAAADGTEAKQVLKKEAAGLRKRIAGLEKRVAELSNTVGQLEATNERIQAAMRSMATFQIAFIEGDLTPAQMVEHLRELKIRRQSRA
ncbi:hypothetical protein VTK56DRAFT_1333 [Thermocarpiscus australiensis]